METKDRQDRKRERAMAHFYLSVNRRRKDKNRSVHPTCTNPNTCRHIFHQKPCALIGCIFRIIYIKGRQMVCARRAALHCSPCHRLACSVQSLHTQSDVPTRHQTDTQTIRGRKERDSASKLPWMSDQYIKPRSILRRHVLDGWLKDCSVQVRVEYGAVGQ